MGMDSSLRWFELGRRKRLGRLPVRRPLLAAVVLAGLLMPLPAGPRSVRPWDAGPTLSPKAPEPPGVRLGNPIVGGEEAQPGAWPWQVALVPSDAVDYYDDKICGGSLIDEEWVLTAAHCVRNLSAPEVDVVAGVHDLANPEQGHQRVGLAQVIVHEEFGSGSPDHDIALLRLSSPVTLGTTYGPTVGLVSLVEAGVGSLAGITATVTGWGSLSGVVDEYPETLQEVQVPVLTNSECESLFDASVGPGDHLTDNMLCAGFAAGGKDHCYGDSGGPLVISDGPEWKQAGIVSWGYGCAEPNRPGVYTRVSQYTQWIEDKIGSGDQSSKAHLPLVMR